MKKNQLILVALVAFIGGIVGGIVSNRLDSLSPAFASGNKDFQKIKVNVVEANEFRVLDDRGWTLARFYHHENSQPARASFDFIDSRAGQKNKLQLSIDKDSIFIIDEKGSVLWSAP